ncbi:MAG TPA: hypothetical protein VLT62_02015 [Candidatus Methylomirabilis sp.]|nr:hypothetical protein [Candidatus Methylomirabilis sp.]
MSRVVLPPVVTLTASAGGDGTFKQWRGDACNGSTSRTCPVPMTAAKSVTAVFSQTFPDATLMPRVTRIKALHFSELGEATNTLRSRFGHGDFSSTAGAPVPGGVVKASCLTDLRVALKQACAAAGRAAPTFTDTVTARTTPIKASHLTELRTFVRNLEQTGVTAGTETPSRS